MPRGGGSRTVHVSGYTRSNGTYVAPYTRSAPTTKTVHVSGYTRSDGTYVAPYTRSAPTTQTPTQTQTQTTTKTVNVSGYTRSDGTYVAPYTRSAPIPNNRSKTTQKYKYKTTTLTMTVYSNYAHNEYNFVSTNHGLRTIENAQIESKTESKIENQTIDKITVIYPNISEEIKQNMLCSISHDILLAPIITNCGHIFSKNQFIKWIDKYNTCPLCRSQIVKIRDLDIMHDVMQLLINVNIEFNNVQYSYLDFLKEFYCCDFSNTEVVEEEQNTENTETIQTIQTTIESIQEPEPEPTLT